MCGIVGWVGAGSSLPNGRQESIAAMTGALEHRGPDDEGVWIDDAADVALGHRRLSILDLSPLGHQPMASAGGRYVVVYNGEIYNFLSLAEELESKGARFRGHSDTEVLLEAVSQWGIREAIPRLNGMFALAVWDKSERTLHLARDRAGEKPLYYWQGAGGVVFASELKALHRHPGFTARTDPDALSLFLRYGYVPAPFTIFAGVRKLPPATLLTIRADGILESGPEEYWSLRSAVERGMAEPLDGSEGEAIVRFEELMLDAVRIRMRADVPLGAFLSGGIDSSLIVAMMQAQSDRPIQSFTIGFSDPRYDESDQAAAVASHLGTRHEMLVATPQDALDMIPRLPEIYDEPFADASQIPTCLVAALTRQHVTVSLSGDAGDELLGGYRRYRRGHRLWRALRPLPAGLRHGVASFLARPSVHNSPPIRAVEGPLRRFTGKRSLGERLVQATHWLAADSPSALHHTLMSHWFDPGRAVIGGAEPLIPATDPARLPDFDGDVVSTMMYLDMLGWLPDDILVKVDRAAMAVALETRIPLLDHRLIELAWRLPEQLKAHPGSGKRVLREILYRYVPRELVDRPKRGFGIPIASWLRGPLRDWAEELLDERRLREHGLLRPEPIRARWEEHVKDRTTWDYELWNVLMFQAWYERWGSEAAAAV